LLKEAYSPVRLGGGVANEASCGSAARLPEPAEAKLAKNSSKRQARLCPRHKRKLRARPPRLSYNSNKNKDFGGVPSLQYKKLCSP